MATPRLRLQGRGLVFLLLIAGVILLLVSLVLIARGGMHRLPWILPTGLALVAAGNILNVLANRRDVRDRERE
ncbi:hypothetical protein [Lapillicoccus jejuensis]|uniref:Uncharacterized protein n=1 Tax=Lapillicoccus jejuensis TaxID=402171 RepID=A0A542DWE2_9MICO|nr:hypothetical protein [Lapillicoccus jejuensis]TQJ07234.1 hypothetical protein FB458_0291 [Lapillicoccus jejuensis]